MDWRERGLLVRESSHGYCYIHSFLKRLSNVDAGIDDVSVFLFKSLQRQCDIVLLVKCNHIMLKGFVMKIFEIKFVHE